MGEFCINRKRLGIFLAISITLLVIAIVTSLVAFLPQTQEHDASRHQDMSTHGIINRTRGRHRMGSVNSDGDNGIIFDNIVFPDSDLYSGNEDIQPSVLQTTKNGL